jgi:hypothetical protein
MSNTETTFVLMPTLRSTINNFRNGKFPTSIQKNQRKNNFIQKLFHSNIVLKEHRKKGDFNMLQTTKIIMLRSRTAPNRK